MKSLTNAVIACFVMQVFTGCIYKSVNISGYAPGLNDAIIEIYKGEERWDDRVSGEKFKLAPNIKKEGFFNLKVRWDGHDRVYIMYLEKGSYDIHFQPGNGAVYPEVICSSDMQKEVSAYYRSAKGKDSEKARCRFVKDNPASIVSAYFLSQAEDMIQLYPERYVPLYNGLSSEAKGSEYGKEGGELIAKVSRNILGAPMPDLKGITPEGQPFNKNVLKGKITLLAFWASWYPPSLTDMASLHSLYNRYHNKGFEIVGISVDRHEDKWRRSIAENKLNWYHVADFKGAYSENFEQFNTQRPRFYILIGPDLKILERDVDLSNVPIYADEYSSALRQAQRSE